MKAIIMAAGRGSRISDKIGDIPKSTLCLTDGTPIIRAGVVKMLECGIQPVVCTGYRKEKIYEALEGLDVKFCHNPFYAVTNNIASLWFTLPEWDGDDILLANADLYYPKSFLERLGKSGGDISMVVDSSHITSGDFYFNVSEDGLIREYGPQVPLEKRSFEYMGLTRISSGLTEMVRELAEHYIDAGNYDKYFEDMVISLNTKYGRQIAFVDVSGEFWREFDFYEDYQAILEYERQNQ